MKSLDLNLMGVQEMNTLEMQETDGGIIWFLVIAAVAVLCSTSSCGNINIQVGGQNNVINNTQTADSAYNGNTLEIPIDVPIGY